LIHVAALHSTILGLLLTQVEKMIANLGAVGALLLLVATASSSPEMQDKAIISGISALLALCQHSHEAREQMLETTVFQVHATFALDGVCGGHHAQFCIFFCVAAADFLDCRIFYFRIQRPLLLGRSRVIWLLLTAICRVESPSFAPSLSAVFQA
jgi:hypothetical protein